MGIKEKVRKRLYDPRVGDLLCEPLHLRILGLGVRLFGNFRLKVVFDQVVKQSYAFGMMRAADFALEQGLKRVIAVEFGVAAGRGLMNLAELSHRVERQTGVHIEVFGIDGGTGMPPPRDYRDHPDLYQAGDFPMIDRSKLRASLPENSHLLVGELTEKVKDVLAVADSQMPIGFVSFDVDYYYSTMEALTLFDGPPQAYLPATVLYFDDIQLWMHNQWCGELLAINDFNDAHQWRKIDRANYIKNSRVYRNAHWLDQIFTLHVLDHPARHSPPSQAQRVLDNPYLR